jgi:hypothetical protein
VSDTLEAPIWRRMNRGMMTESIARLPTPVSNAGGTLHANVMGCHRHDGGWDGWLEFVSTTSDAVLYTTGVETHQQTRTQLERWASGLTAVYAEGALARARPMQSESTIPDLLLALTEVVDALTRRVPHIERAGESAIAADAARLRDAAMQRIELLRAQSATRR